MKITFKDLEDSNCTSVTDYCRLLVSENKRDYSDEKILVFRNDMLCLTVNNIYKAAKLEPAQVGFRKYTPRSSLKHGIEATSAPYSDLN